MDGQIFDQLFDFRRSDIRRSDPSPFNLFWFQSKSKKLKKWFWNRFKNLFFWRKSIRIDKIIIRFIHFIHITVIFEIKLSFTVFCPWIQAKNTSKFFLLIFKELWFLCDLITALGMHHDQLFLQPGLRSEIILIRDWLDTGKIQNLNISNFPRNFFYLEM